MRFRLKLKLKLKPANKIQDMTFRKWHKNGAQQKEQYRRFFGGAPRISVINDF